MMYRCLLFLCCTLFTMSVRATRVTGTVTDDKGNLLAYASILVKGTTRGVTASQEGKYLLDLSPGEYTLICQFVGYAKQEKKIRVGADPAVLDFHLSLQQLSMAEVVVRPGGEDPAYAIIRHAIQKRKEYQAPLDSFSCEVYIKTLLKTRKLPKKIMGKELQEKDRKEMGVDSVGKGILFLSESLTRASFKKPDKLKLEVLSGRESGSNGFGFTVPTFVNFYDNIVYATGPKLNPRGFVSPIAAGALNYYRYKFLGSFFEDGKEINAIQVIPRRKYEPLFSGTIDITDGDWRIHSLDLLLVRSAGLELLDTLVIKQLHAPLDGSARAGAGKDVWQIRNQTVYFSFNIMGVDAVGSFLNVYNNYDVAPRFRKKFFNNVLIKYDTAGNKKGREYWDSIRPLPLEQEEVNDYEVRDSIYRYRRDSLGTHKNRDSLLKQQGPVTAGQLLFSGFHRSNFRMPRPIHYSLEPVIPAFDYNTVEGLNIDLAGSISRALKTEGDALVFTPHLRYGFHNTHLEPWASISLNRGMFSEMGNEAGQYKRRWILSGGKRVSQFNPADPIPEFVNGIYTVLFRRNYMKIYEEYFTSLSHSEQLDNGLKFTIDARYEDRLPLANTSDWSLFHPEGRQFTVNYPYEKLSAPVPRHQALLTGVELEYQPGQRFVEFPHRRMSLGSDFPTFSLMYRRGWKDVLGSDVDFDKWQFSVWDDINLRLKGLFRYRLSMGGFLNDRSVFIQDYQHFNGNQTFFANAYLDGFQLAPYYANSTTASFYVTGHIEEHFNGMLTNKIPVFRKLNWYLVAGGNAFYVNRSNNYVEAFGGLENIFKLFRVDVISSYLNGHYNQTGVRLGLGGLLGSGVKFRQRPDGL